MRTQRDLALRLGLLMLAATESLILTMEVLTWLAASGAP